MTMLRLTALAVLLPLTTSAALHAQTFRLPPASTTETDLSAVDQVIQEFKNARSTCLTANRQLPSAEQREHIRLNLPKPKDYSQRLWDLAELDPTGDEAFKAMVWVAKQNMAGSFGASLPWRDQALGAMSTHHAEREDVGDMLTRLSHSVGVGVGAFFDQLIENSPHQSVRGIAMMCRGLHYLGSADEVAPAQFDPERIAQIYGKATSAMLVQTQASQLNSSAEALFLRVLEDYAEIEWEGKPLGESATAGIQRIERLSIGSVAQEIEGVDLDGNEFLLSDYEGQVVLINFWAHW